MDNEATEPQVPQDAPILVTAGAAAPAAATGPTRIKLKVKAEQVIVELPPEVEGGEVVEKVYEVREMAGLQRDMYLNTQKGKIDMETQQLQDFTGFYSLLLSYTLYDDTGKLVPQKTIQTYPNEAQAALHAIAEKLNKVIQTGDKKPGER